MVYECDQCGTALPPGVVSCPKCGERFSDAVPPDAKTPHAGYRTANAVSPVSPALAQSAPKLSGIIALLLIIACLLGAIALHIPAQGAIAPHWEYAIQDVPDDGFTQKMNDLGNQGWELVSARRASNGTDSPTLSYKVIFKRPRQ